MPHGINVLYNGYAERTSFLKRSTKGAPEYKCVVHRILIDWMSLLVGTPGTGQINLLNLWEREKSQKLQGYKNQINDCAQSPWKNPQEKSHWRSENSSRQDNKLPDRPVSHIFRGRNKEKKKINKSRFRFPVTDWCSLLWKGKKKRHEKTEGTRLAQRSSSL